VGCSPLQNFPHLPSEVLGLRSPHGEGRETCLSDQVDKVLQTAQPNTTNFIRNRTDNKN
jgi:hypothetical protein